MIDINNKALCVTLVRFNYNNNRGQQVYSSHNFSECQHIVSIFLYCCPLKLRKASNIRPQCR